MSTLHRQHTAAGLRAALRQALLVWLALMLLAALTLTLAYLPLGSWQLPANLAIAVLMVALVAAYFMNLRRATALTLLTAFAAFLFLIAMFGLSFNDLFTRI